MAHKTDTNPETVSIYDWEARSLLFRKKGETDQKYTYLYGPGETNDVVGPAKVYGIAEAGNGDRWFLFWVVDCFSPPCYAVKAEGEGDAFYQFITDFEDMVKIEDHFEDYTDDERVAKLNEEKRAAGDFSGVTLEQIDGLNVDLRCEWNHNGTPCDTDKVHMEEVELVEAMAYPRDKHPQEVLVYMQDYLQRIKSLIEYPNPSQDTTEAIRTLVNKALAAKPIK